MSNDPTDIWSWVMQEKERMHCEGGIQQILAENHDRFSSNLDNNYALAEIAINTALDAARVIGDVRWELFLRHWRLQLYSRMSDMKRMLPEAIDLLTLATDERVRDVPQRICAYHDVVDCYVRINAEGYCQEILDNCQHLLAQLPTYHSCATCIRRHGAMALAAAGRADEAKQWIAQCEARLTEANSSQWLT